MEDSFNVRVDKIFGSLSKPPKSDYSPTPTPTPRPLWCLTDEEIERREWNRHKDDEEDDDDQRRVAPGSSSKLVDKSALKSRRWLGDLSDEEEEGGGGGDRNVGGAAVNEVDEDVLEIRASIGLDPTLDNEAEEDAYDKMAQGKEGDTECRLFMKDATDYGPHLNFHNVLPSSVHDVPRDPRANVSAAKSRLEEDAAVWKAKLASGQTCDQPTPIGERTSGPVSEDSEDDLIAVKPILKRKSDLDVKTSSTSKTESIVKSMKRVRFDVSCKNEDASDCKNEEYVDASDKSQGFSPGTSGSATAEVDDPFSDENIKRRVPDYLLNPGRYTHYTFDSLTNDSEESNTKACMDLFELLRRSKSKVSEETLDDSSADAPHSLKFVPRKKASEGQAGTISCGGNRKQSFSQVGSGVSVVGTVADEGEVCAMEEDEPDLDPSRTSTSFKKAGRNFRTKVEVEEDDA